MEFGQDYYESFGDYSTYMQAPIEALSSLVRDEGFRSVLILGSGYVNAIPALLDLIPKVDVMGVESSDYARRHADFVTAMCTWWTTRERAVARLHVPYELVVEHTLQYLDADDVVEGVRTACRLADRALHHDVFYEGDEQDPPDHWRRTTQPKSWWDALFIAQDFRPDPDNRYLYWKV